MADDDAPAEIQIPLVWTGAEDAPILFANAFVCQFDQDLGAHLLTVGQVAPPPLIGTPDEVREQLDRIDFVPVRVIARLALTPARMTELLAALQANVDQREQAANLRPGDPR
jgi:hypothetical protein